MASSNPLLQRMRKLASSSSSSTSRTPPAGGRSTSSEEEWSPPPMRLPLEKGREEGAPWQPLETLPRCQTHEEILALPELLPDGSERMCYVARAPSPPADGMDSPLMDSPDRLNVIMADVSSSMSGCWKDVVKGWNQHVAPLLTGESCVYAFGNRVFLLRSGAFLEDSDFVGGGTDLVGALRTLVSRVYECGEPSVRAFFITDGGHSVSPLDPKKTIDAMKPPEGKECSVYVLGIGEDFPVQHSLGLRCRLHNGSSNVPSLFMARSPKDIDEQMRSIGRSYGSRIVRMSVRGSCLPGGVLQDTFHAGEWVSLEGEVRELAVSFGGRQMQLCLQNRTAGLEDLMTIFRQWNSIVIQLRVNGGDVPRDVLPLKERLFRAQVARMNVRGAKNIGERLARKRLAQFETAFRTELNSMDNILSSTFRSERELAENVLQTTVRAKHESRAFAIRGHAQGHFATDAKEFARVMDSCRERLAAHQSNPEDLCRITLSSTLTDLRDPDFADLLQAGKFDFLRSFCVTGMPVLSRSVGLAALNPWAYTVRTILNDPFAVLSQVALEDSARVSAPSGPFQEVKVGQEGARFNAVVPLFAQVVARDVAPLLRTRLFAMCASFAILKNPHVVDFNIHLAALGACWAYLLKEYPLQERPEFVRTRLQDLEATAGVYLERSDVARYLKALQECPERALLPDGMLLKSGKTVRSETLLKPLFMSFLKREEASRYCPEATVRLILQEYVNRCLSDLRKDSPYTTLFAPEVLKEDWPREHAAEALGIATSNPARHYTLQDAKKAARRELRDFLKEMQTPLTIAKLDWNRIAKLENANRVGGVNLPLLMTFAREIGLSEDAVSDIFSERNLFASAAHAIMTKHTGGRLCAKPQPFQVARSRVAREITRERTRRASRTFFRELVREAEGAWRREHAISHSGLVKPMDPREIVDLARSRGVGVDEASFQDVYRHYRKDLGLLGNACQCPACPFFLQPDRRFNEHARGSRSGQFPHAFHRAALANRLLGPEAALRDLTSGRFSKAGVPLKNLKEGLDADMKELVACYQRRAEGGS